MGKRSTLDDPRIVRPNYCMLIAWSSGQPKGAVENTGKFIAIKAIKMAPPRGAVNTNFIYFSRWWGRQDSNLRRHSQRIYSPPPLPLGTLPQSRRTVLISKDKSGSPAGRSGCVGLMRELPPPSQSGKSQPFAGQSCSRRRHQMKKAAGGSGGFLSTATCGATRQDSSFRTTTTLRI